MTGRDKQEAQPPEVPLQRSRRGTNELDLVLVSYRQHNGEDPGRQEQGGQGASVIGC